ncbi:gamma-glutamyltransferase [Thiorhodococcus minor]|uniref:Glutathione hydrolase proenzyme n=1 Tax=Thiorhodococcus minor TaxID=57489 RepID=A0A6M0K2K1_9GAMM|nr:gamma-glutamyltransferase [Thiorhodococcus minor]NEV62797.1 gamma-glutamyltransferase [Thiorhodococcus minor]
MKASPRSPVPGLPAVLCLLLSGPLWAWYGAPQDRAPDGHTPHKAAIASPHPLATEAGLAVLGRGGNAFDAAVTVSAALAVVEPYGSGLGGGGFWLLHRAADGRQVMIDGRERAPLAAHRDLYMGADGRFAREQALNGPLAAGIPGVPAALCHLSERYGRAGLEAALAPAIRAARDGFAVDARYRRRAELRLAALRDSPAAARQFLADGRVPPLGYRLKQPDLAETLQRISEEGCDAFYLGPLARRMVRGVREAGGIWTEEDLAQYGVVEREPVRGRYQGWRLVSAAPPSSGGVLLVEMLNMLSAVPQDQRDAAPPAHLLAEVMRRAYRDRAAYLGDPDHVRMPLARLTDEDYAAGLIRDFDPRRATPSRPAENDHAQDGREGRDTTHFSILDPEGNRVAATLSINYPFGSGFVPPGTGVLLNDEMDDFSARPGVPNAYGLVGGEANAIAPGKRMLSSMSPSFLESDDGVAILGTPGGSRIITMVLQAILAAVERAPVADWVARPRIHHQYLPDRIQAEPGALAPSEQASLRALGHRLELLDRRFGNMQVVFWNRRAGRVEAASDPRGIGSARVQ